MTRAVGLCVLAVATLALAGCGDGGAAVYHNTVAHGYNRIAVAEKKLQNAVEASLEKKGERDFDTLNDRLKDYRTAVAEARRDFEKVPAPEGDLAPKLKTVYLQYLDRCDDSARAYEELCQPAQAPRKDEKGHVRKVFEDEARNNKALGDELRKLQEQLVTAFGLEVKRPRK
jgi:hypothetical protein